MPPDQNLARPKRKDAVLNNERLLQAAREVFAQRGLSATLEDIARHAGIGVGTVYRNFPSKRAIVTALYDAAIDSALADVEEALRIDDPWLALVTFFEVTAANQARDRGLSESLLGHDRRDRHGGRDRNDGHDRNGRSGPAEQMAEKIVAVVSPLFERASAAGVLREGVLVTDLLPIFAMLDSVYRLSETSPDLWRRYLAILLDGLRADERPALPVPALDVAAFTAALATGD